MRICEIYSSIQGEGVLTGTSSTFVRTSGCNLRCIFCDTPFASWKPEGQNLTVDEILEQVSKYTPKHVVITGGEPMIAPGLDELCDRLHDEGFHITIETAGTVFRQLHCDLMSISPKMSNSNPSIEAAGLVWSQRHERDRLNPFVVQQLMEQADRTEQADYQLKFVIDTRNDADEVIDYLNQLHDVDRQRVLLMPQGTTIEALESRAEWLIEWCRAQDFRFCDRAHIRWFGNRRGT